MTTAHDRRVAAVKALHDWATDHRARYAVNGNWSIAGADELVEHIRALHGMSRAPRWDKAVEDWAQLVEAERDSGGHTDWAYVQGAVWFGYAVEGL